MNVLMLLTVIDKLLEKALITYDEFKGTIGKDLDDATLAQIRAKYDARIAAREEEQRRLDGTPQG